VKNTHTFIIDYAYGFHADTCEPDYVSRLRSQATLRAYKKYPDAYIVLSAGMKSVTGDCGPLADMMESYFLREHISPERILRNPKGHDTQSETAAAYALIKKYGGGKVICATSAFHAPRVWCIWVARYGIIPKMFTTKYKPHPGMYLKELVKIPIEIIRSLLLRTRDTQR